MTCMPGSLTHTPCTNNNSLFLQAKRSSVKLDIYRKFSNALAVAVIASVVWIGYEVYSHLNWICVFWLRFTFYSVQSFYTTNTSHSCKDMISVLLKHSLSLMFYVNSGMF